jgi:hypothetical protein
VFVNNNIKSKKQSYNKMNIITKFYETVCNEKNTNNNKIILKIGKQIFEGCFNTSIDKEKYILIFEKYKNKNKQMKNKKYYIYSSFDKNLLIFSNGMNKCYKTINYLYSNEENYRLEYSENKYLSNDLFQPEYEYDSIFQYNEKIIELQESVVLVFTEKINMKNKKTFYNIEIRMNMKNIDKNDIELLITDITF